ncbi:MAG: serine hydrolase domain-containing protein [Pseudomonadota bacterium]
MALILLNLLPWLPQGAASAETVPWVRYSLFEGGSEIDHDGQGVSIDTPFAIASVGKTMTSVAVLRMAERGTLSVDDPVSDWVTADISRGLGGLQTTSLRHLLTMTSGLPDYYIETFLEDALDDPDNVQTPQSALRYVYDTPRHFPPGADFEYSNTNYVLLGLILENATGRSYAEVLQQEVFAPAQMAQSFVFGDRDLPRSFAKSPDHTEDVRAYYQGAGFGDGGVISTARDLARFYSALFLDRSLLERAMMDALMTDPLGAAYGMGLEVEDGLVGHSGGDLGFSSDVRLDLETGALAIELVAAEDAKTGWTFDQMPE